MARSRGARERTERSLERHKPKLAPKPSTLIVCEGEKTETLYFHSMRSDLRLGTVHVEICGKECGSAPISVVQFALRMYEQRGKDARKSQTKLPFERVFCVMDKDRHPSLDEALDLIESSRAKNFPIEAIVSRPCFEIWYSLHFRYSTKPFTTFAELVPELPKELKGYAKEKDVYAILKPETPTAILNAERLEAYQRTASTERVPNPSTKVHEVVKVLQAMANPQ